MDQIEQGAAAPANPATGNQLGGIAVHEQLAVPQSPTVAEVTQIAPQPEAVPGQAPAPTPSLEEVASNPQAMLEAMNKVAPSEVPGWRDAA